MHATDKKGDRPLYCPKYNACGRPVYFVRDRWYNEVYVPQYQGRPLLSSGQVTDAGPKAGTQ